MQGCGKTHHTFLHFTDTRGSANQGALSQHREVVNQNLVPDQGTTSTCSTSASVGPCEVLLQVIPVKVMSSAGCKITTYVLIDSGSDITMIDPSLVELLNIKGSPNKLSLTTVHSVDAEEVGMKVDFKIGSVDSQNENVTDVKSAWAVKDLTIPLKAYQGHKVSGAMATFTPCVFSGCGEKEDFCVDWHQPPRSFHTT